MKFLQPLLLHSWREYFPGLPFPGGPDNSLSGWPKATGGDPRLSLDPGLSKIFRRPPARYARPDNKLSGPPKMPRSLLPGVLLTVLNFGMIAVPACAQNAPSGPVHLPPPGVTNALSAIPVVSSSAPATINPAPLPSPVAPAVNPGPTPASTPQSSASAEDIHDIRGPISIPYEWLWAAYVAAALALAALLYALWRYVRGRAKTKAKLPFEIALERLEAARALMSPDTVRDYAFTVSEIIRVYIEQCFGEKAARRTTEEFLSDLLEQTNTPLARHRRLLEDFLNHCDLIKFARWGASTRELESMHESARVFILDTRPLPEAAKSQPQPNPPVQPELVRVP